MIKCLGLLEQGLDSRTGHEASGRLTNLQWSFSCESTWPLNRKAYKAHLLRCLKQQHAKIYCYPCYLCSLYSFFAEYSGLWYFSPVLPKTTYERYLEIQSFSFLFPSFSILISKIFLPVFSSFCSCHLSSLISVLSCGQQIFDWHYMESKGPLKIKCFRFQHISPYFISPRLY